MSQKIYKIIFILLVIALIIVSILIAFKYINGYENDLKNKEVVEEFIKSVQNISSSQTKAGNKNSEFKEPVTMNGYQVIGIIKIQKIGIEYPILDINASNPDETKEPMKYGIVKYWGGNVNDYGNLSIAGHNYYNGTMFGKTKKLEIGDKLELTDLNNNIVEYEIYEKLIVDPNDVTILLSKDRTIREVTLITCTNGNKNRLVLKAKEVIK